MKAPAEKLAYVVRLNPTGDGRRDALCVVDVDPQSSTYGQVVGAAEMPHAGLDKVVSGPVAGREVAPKGGTPSATLVAGEPPASDARTLTPCV